MSCLNFSKCLEMFENKLVSDPSRPKKNIKFNVQVTILYYYFVFL